MFIGVVLDGSPRNDGSLVVSERWVRSEKVVESMNRAARVAMIMRLVCGLLVRYLVEKKK